MFEPRLSEISEREESMLKTWIREQQDTFMQQIMQEMDKCITNVKQELTRNIEDLQTRYETKYRDLDRRISLIESRSGTTPDIKSAVIEPVSAKIPAAILPTPPQAHPPAAIPIKPASITRVDSEEGDQVSLADTLRKVTRELNSSLGCLANVIDDCDLPSVHEVMRLCNSFSDDILKPVSDDQKIVRARDWGGKINEKLFPRVPRETFVSRLENRNTNVIAESLDKMTEKVKDVSLITKAKIAFENEENRKIIGQNMRQLRNNVPGSAPFVVAIEKELVIKNFFNTLQKWKAEMSRVLLVRRCSGDIAKPPANAAPPAAIPVVANITPKRVSSNPGASGCACKGCYEALTKLNMAFSKELNDMNEKICQALAQQKTDIDDVKAQLVYMGKKLMF